MSEKTKVGIPGFMGVEEVRKAFDATTNEEGTELWFVETGEEQATAWVDDTETLVALRALVDSVLARRGSKNV